MDMKSIRRAGGFALALMMFLTVSPPLAVAGRMERERDPRGDNGGPLDLEKVIYGPSGLGILFKVRTYDEWEPSIFDSGAIIVAIDMKPNPGRDPYDRTIVVDYNARANRPRAEILDRAGERVAGIPLGYGRDHIDLYVEPWKLGPGRIARFNVFSQHYEGDPPASDRLPDEGEIERRIRPLCFGSLPTIHGTAGDDRIKGTPRDDIIAAGSGDDVIIGAGGADAICGGAGDDRIETSNSPYQFVRGGSGQDRIDVGDAPLGTCDDTGSGSASCAYPQDAVWGGAGDDVISGSAGSHDLNGGRGDDRIAAGRGSDRLNGGAGNDRVAGGRGEDSCAKGEAVRGCES
ncbi:MAG: hypothetical protein QOG54_631 [Actinomycetota bacterium]|jgi:hypothetical protein|nr:hypothetical protein [Actinomycetota bacterium]